MDIDVGILAQKMGGNIAFAFYIGIKHMAGTGYFKPCTCNKFPVAVNHPYNLYVSLLVCQELVTEQYRYENDVFQCDKITKKSLC